MLQKQTSLVTVKGQVTIPADFRNYLQLSEGDRVSFEQDSAGRVIIEKAEILSFPKFAEEIAKSFQDKGISKEEMLEEVWRVREKLLREDKGIVDKDKS